MLKRIDKNNKEQLQSYLQSRSQEIESDILIKVSEIINEVRMKKDEALKKYTYQFDKIKVDTFKVTEEEIDEAFSIRHRNKMIIYFIKNMGFIWGSVYVQSKV